MTSFRKTGERGKRWDFRARDCIGCACWSPGLYRHSSGSGTTMRMTGATSLCCMRRAYHGCPNDDDEQRQWNAEMAKQRVAEGWRPA